MGFYETIFFLRSIKTAIKKAGIPMAWDMDR